MGYGKWQAARGQGTGGREERRHRDRRPTRRIDRQASGGKARIWDIASGSEVGDVPDNVRDADVAFSPDGLRIAIVSANTLKIWEANTPSAPPPNRNQRWRCSTRQCILEWEVDGGASWPVFSPDGQRVAAFMRNTTRIWNASVGDQVVILKRLTALLHRQVSRPMDGKSSQFLTPRSDLGRNRRCCVSRVAPRRGSWAWWSPQCLLVRRFLAGRSERCYGLRRRHGEDMEHGKRGPACREAVPGRPACPRRIPRGWQAYRDRVRRRKAASLAGSVRRQPRGAGRRSRSCQLSGRFERRRTHRDGHGGRQCTDMGRQSKPGERVIGEASGGGLADVNLAGRPAGSPCCRCSCMVVEWHGRHRARTARQVCRHPDRFVLD